MRVLGFGTYDLGKHPRVGIVLDGLRSRGEDVVAINEPLGFTTTERVAMLGKPWLAYRLVARVLTRWGRLTLAALRLKRGPQFDAIVVGYLGQFDVLLARLLFPRSRIVLDMLIFGADTARDRGVSGTFKLRLLDTLDRLAVRCANLVLVDTEEALSLLAVDARAKAIVVPVGAEECWFTAGQHIDGPSSTTLKVVFFGLYTPLQGTTVIGESLGALADRPDIEVTMIGTGQDYEATRLAADGNKSVTWLDWVEAEELPRVIAAHDVCLGIFGTTPKALRVVPNKVYEGAAASCAIVTSNSPPQLRMLGDAACYVPPGDAAALADALRSLAADVGRTKALRLAARSLAADRFTPPSIVEPLRERLSELCGGRPA